MTADVLRWFVGVLGRDTASRLTAVAPMAWLAIAGQALWASYLGVSLAGPPPEDRGFLS